MHSKLVILERDGTLNRASDGCVQSPQEWVPLPGALEAIGRLNRAGYRVVLASNQSGLGRGLFDMAALNSVHAGMLKALAAHGARIDAVFYCPHTPDEDCHCRKPAPGLFEEIAERYGVSLQGVPCIGSSLRDMQAAAAVGAAPHLVCTAGHQALRGQSALPPEFPPDTRCHDGLAACVEHVLAAHPREPRQNP
ncbi:MAG: D-glycero-beta-D-manno-heptose 1,7-bisphosphate 7-phosphatase [Betaproteobacteria bacterium]|nr:D-glycero-beta-D-manno-heptose 1,7-bisphosphate 7-phosphatase [Betaproteobacteria bacterium]